jgi:uncharacterized protein YjeT (DUF2065 family)
VPAQIEASNLVVGLALGVFFGVGGLVFLLFPTAIQRFATSTWSSGKSVVPPSFAAFVESSKYIVALRLVGVASILASVFVLYVLSVEYFGL